MKLHPFWWFIAPEVPCPTGEQIVNGDFEDGATGWTFDSANSSISTSYAHSPTHSVFTYSDGLGFHQSIDNLLVSCVQSLTFYTIAPYGTPATVTAKITYSDGSSSSRVINSSGTWTQQDITDLLDAGKTITEIRFTSSTDNPTHIDDVSLISG